MVVEIVFELHQLSEDNERGVATGWLDGRLSERGRLFARQLGQRRASQRIDAVFTSDLGRAVETAELAFGDTDLEIYRDHRLRECNYGALNGKPVEQLEGQRREHIHTPFPDGESYVQVVERVRDFLVDLSSAWQGGRVVVIGHSATRWALDHLLCGQPLEGLVDVPMVWQEGWNYQLK
jgi:broad specificity phosphatase PhoE